MQNAVLRTLVCERWYQPARQHKDGEPRREPRRLPFRVNVPRKKQKFIKSMTIAKSLSEISEQKGIPEEDERLLRVETGDRRKDGIAERRLGDAAG